MDPRRTLIIYFANLINELKLDFVFMENVTGLERFEPDSFAYFINTLAQNKYLWDKDIVNAAKHGVPQNRKRFVLLVSLHSGIKIPLEYYDGAMC